MKKILILKNGGKIMVDQEDIEDYDRETDEIIDMKDIEDYLTEDECNLFMKMLDEELA